MHRSVFTFGVLSIYSYLVLSFQEAAKRQQWSLQQSLFPLLPAQTHCCRYKTSSSSIWEQLRIISKPVTVLYCFFFFSFFFHWDFTDTVVKLVPPIELAAVLKKGVQPPPIKDQKKDNNVHFIALEKLIQGLLFPGFLFQEEKRKTWRTAYIRINDNVVLIYKHSFLSFGAA